MILRDVVTRCFANASDLVVVPAIDAVELELTASRDLAAVVLPLEVLNAFVGPGTPLRLELVP